MAEGSGEKSEKATPKKQQDLRKKGAVARSVELPAGLSLMALVLVLPGGLSRLAEVLSADMAVALSSAGNQDLGAAGALASNLVRDAAKAFAPLVAVVGASSLLAAVGVTRSKPNLRQLRPKGERLNPTKAIKQMLSPHTVFELLKSTGKLLALALVSVGVWQQGYARLVSGPGSLPQMLSTVGTSLHTLLLRAAALAVLVGIADAAWSRRRFGKQSRMTKHEVREEAKSSEGNPHIKGAIRQRQAKMSRSRMMAAMSDADVVLANPTHVVVALSYRASDSAPVVVAKGAGAAAARLKEKARELDVPVVEDKPLARGLWQAAEVGNVIPPEFYRAVAEVLAAVFAARRGGPADGPRTGRGAAARRGPAASPGAAATRGRRSA